MQKIILAFLAATTLLVAQNTSAQPVPEVKGSESYREAFNFVRKRKFDEAKQSVSRLDANNPASLAERLAIEAWMEFMRCRFDTAEAKARAALAASSTQPLSLMLMSRLLESKNQKAEAAAYGKQLMREDPNNAVLLARIESAFADPKDFPSRLELIKHLAALVEAPEFAASKKRMLGSLAVQTKLNGRPTEVLADDSKRMELPFVLDASRRALVEWTLPDGSKTNAILDSGATALVLTSKTADAYKREKLADETIDTIAGEGAAETALLESFSLGGMRWSNVVCSTGATYPQNLIGMNLFANTVFVVDFKRSRLLAYADAAAFEKEWAEDLRGAAKMEFRLIGGFITVPCTMTANDAAEARSAFVLDTGANSTKLGKRFADRWSSEQGVRMMDIAARMVGGAGDKGQVVNQAVSNVGIHAGGLKFFGAQMGILDFASVQQSIGADFSVLMGTDQMLARDFVIIDFPRRFIYMGRAKGN